MIACGPGRIVGISGCKEVAAYPALGPESLPGNWRLVEGDGVVWAFDENPWGRANERPAPLLRSLDQGATWDIVAMESNDGPPDTIARGERSVLWGARHGLLMRSHDGGARWEGVADVRAIVRSGTRVCAGGQTVAVFEPNGLDVAISGDAGATFRPVRLAAPVAVEEDACVGLSNGALLVGGSVSSRLQRCHPDGCTRIEGGEAGEVLEPGEAREGGGAVVWAIGPHGARRGELDSQGRVLWRKLAPGNARDVRAMGGVRLVLLSDDTFTVEPTPVERGFGRFRTPLVRPDGTLLVVAVRAGGTFLAVMREHVLGELGHPSVDGYRDLLNPELHGDALAVVGRRGFARVEWGKAAELRWFARELEALASPDGRRYLALAERRFVRSVDGGATWLPVDSPPPVRVYPRPHHIAGQLRPMSLMWPAGAPPVVTVDGEAFRGSEDASTFSSWSVPDGAPTPAGTGADEWLVQPFRNGWRLYRSVKGAAFTEDPSAPGWPLAPRGPVLVDDHSCPRHVSTDGARTWSAVPARGEECLFTARGRSLVTLWAEGRRLKIARSDGGRGNFKRVAGRGLPAVGTETVVNSTGGSIACLDNACEKLVLSVQRLRARGYVSTLYRSDDGGSTWYEDPNTPAGPRLVASGEAALIIDRTGVPWMIR